MQAVVLASTSTYRAALLARLGVPFSIEAPQCNEIPLPSESAPVLAERLAIDKAQSVASKNSTALIIGSDQVVCVVDKLMGKPGNKRAARAQLRQMQGCRVHIFTAVCIIDAAKNCRHVFQDTTSALLRTLTEAEIQRYIDADKPLDCAGSFKAEGLGISLFEEIESIDPTALVGLPLMGVARILRTAGIPIP